MKSWNSKKYEWWYKEAYREATEHGFSDVELAQQNLSNPYLNITLPVGTEKVYRLIKLAYFLGRLRQIRWMDEGLNMVSQSGVENGEKN